ncbi:MAG: hypothetical protein JWP97_4107 [Labilithrix sp.]|nr:hypothetical protein [Labilithrix sp.]
MKKISRIGSLSVVLFLGATAACTSTAAESTEEETLRRVSLSLTTDTTIHARPGETNISGIASAAYGGALTISTAPDGFRYAKLSQDSRIQGSVTCSLYDQAR